MTDLDIRADDGTTAGRSAADFEAAALTAEADAARLRQELAAVVAAAEEARRSWMETADVLHSMELCRLETCVEPVVFPPGWRYSRHGHLSRYPITRRTPQRIYYRVGDGRERFVDRTRLLQPTNGWLFGEPSLEMPPHVKKEAHLRVLRRDAAQKHPDRGGDDELFDRAMRRYRFAQAAGR